MAVDPFFAPPQRLTLFDLTRVGEEDSSLEVQFNPTEYTEKIQALYGKLQPIGQPHQVLQYQGTVNHNINMQLFFLAQGPDTRNKILEAKAFLQSLLYPRRSASTVAGGSPPDVLLVWPNSLTMTVRVMQLSIVNQRFSRSTGQPVQFTATCTFEERRTTRWTSEDARHFGSVKSPRPTLVDPFVDA